MPLLFLRQEDELVPELDDNPGATGGTTFSVLQKNLPLFGQPWFLTAHSLEYPCSSQSFPSDRTAGVSSSSCTVTNMPRSWTKTRASSFVCTSPSGHHHHRGVRGSSQSVHFV